MFVTAISLLSILLTPTSTAQASATAATPDSAAIVAAVAAFHAALVAGDSVGALALLAPDAVILESGDLETRADYASHHLGADMAFVRAVPSTRVTTEVFQDGGTAWVASVTTSKGTFRDRPISSQGAELMVLSRTDAGWRIRAIHWSSRRL
jgi:ketosteroid isomerase-like protein